MAKTARGHGMGKAGELAAATVDKKLKARWEQEFTRFTQAKGAETEGWDELYEALDAILNHDPPLYRAGGYKSARAFLKDHMKGQDIRTVQANIRVAKHFDPKDERAHGTAKLALLLDYLEASTGSSELPAKLDPSQVRVEVKDGKSTRKARFPELSYDELRAAVRAAKGRRGQPVKTDSPAVRAIRKTLREGGWETVGVRGRGTRVDLTGIEVGQLPAIGKALARLKL